MGGCFLLLFLVVFRVWGVFLRCGVCVCVVCVVSVWGRCGVGLLCVVIFVCVVCCSVLQLAVIKPHEDKFQPRKHPKHIDQSK